MRFDFKEYLLDSEGNDYYTLYKRGIVKADGSGKKQPKEENVGKESLNCMGYFNNIEFALKKMGNDIVTGNSDLETVIEKLDSLEKEIIEVSRKLNLRVKIVE